MAVVTAPFFGFGASGKIADALVYFNWKGLNVVRSYVIPANPQSALQVTQRGHLEDAVDEWHAASYEAVDIAAFNRLANLAPGAMSGFNRMVQEMVLEARAANTWERLTGLTLPNTTAVAFDGFIGKTSGGNAPTMRWGKTPTNMPDSAVCVDQFGDQWRGRAEGLTAETLYYFTFDIGTRAADWGRTGIYTVRTIAA